MLVLRPEEPLFFANAEPIMTQVRELVLGQRGRESLVLSLEESPDLDSTALESAAEFCSWFTARGGELRVARLKESAREALLRAGVAQLHAGTLDYSSVDDAVRGRSVRGAAGLTRCGAHGSRAPVTAAIKLLTPRRSPHWCLGPRCWRGTRLRLGWMSVFVTDP